MGKISEFEKKARKEGISYGQWVARHRAAYTPRGRDVKRCPVCGAEVPLWGLSGSKRVYCSDRCAYLAREMRKQKRAENE